MNGQVLPWSREGRTAETDAIVSGAAVRRAAMMADTPRDVAVGYTARHGGSYAASRSLTGVSVLEATAIILEDLAIPAEHLVVREIACGEPRALALMIRAVGSRPGRVVAIVKQGLTEHDLNLALLFLTPAGTAA